MVKRCFTFQFLGFLTTCGLLSGCTYSRPSGLAPSNSSVPIVTNIVSNRIEKSGDARSIAHNKFQMLKRRKLSKELSGAFASPSSPVLSSIVTFQKAEILGREFLYGSDLQYSSIGDDMMLQSLSIGHVTARFQILGDKLQLFAEEKYRFESDINIPLNLLAEWKIQSSTANEITVEIASASPVLATVVESEDPLRASWIRSVEFVPQGNYLLIESSVELANGKVAEFMESLFPRETLVKNAPKPIFDDGDREPLAKRFGFLSNEVWIKFDEGKEKTAVAQRFAPPAAGTTIDWYVTPNVPAEYLPSIRDGVEGWNRYSQKMWGRDFIRFKGTLPAGVKIGDPRYNVINWDSVADASSAYESQAADMETGIQSHSLIYLPYAWVKIGEEFWKRGELSQSRTVPLKNAIDSARFMGRPLRVNCFNDGEMALTPLMKENPDVFSKELLKGTLFHEVGHALGLAHNFKGSLSFDSNTPGSIFSASIMDYSQYQLESGAFDQPGVAQGPLLEYDRQILSALYNEGKDIAATDPVVPHCDDSVADQKAGGVDPLCIRYDAGQDPTVQLVRTFGLIEDPAASIAKTRSLASAIENAATALPDASKVTSEDELAEAESDLAATTSALTQYYINAGGQSVASMLNLTLKELLIFAPDTLPSTMDADAMRERVASSFEKLLILESIPSATRKSYEKVAAQAVQWLKTTAWYAGATQDVQTARETRLQDKILGGVKTFESTAFGKIRARLLGNLKRDNKAPFYLSPNADFEVRVLGWFSKVLTQTLPSGASYSIAERTAAATALSTFAGIDTVTEMKTIAKIKVETEIRNSRNAVERESLRNLRNLLL